jgi:hypothetical protein
VCLPGRLRLIGEWWSRWLPVPSRPAHTKSNMHWSQCKQLIGKTGSCEGTAAGFAPKLPRPQMKMRPSSVSAMVCVPPHTAWTTLQRSMALTSQRAFLPEHCRVLALQLQPPT